MIALYALLQLSLAHADVTVCFETGKTCSDVDIDQPRAEEAYRKGCDSGDAYSCARLGQLVEVKRGDRERAVAFYDRACKGNDSFGCEQAANLHLELCYVEAKKAFCDGREPKGEIRVLLFLRDFNPKYDDAFRDHNFDNPWTLRQTEVLFRRRVKEKNKKLLRALQAELKAKRHDGADGEGLRHQITCLKTKCPAFDDEYL